MAGLCIWSTMDLLLEKDTQTRCCEIVKLAAARIGTQICAI